MNDADALPAPFRSSTQTVEPEWIDYNGHMNVAYYTLAFDRALDELFEALGIGPTAARGGDGQFPLHPSVLIDFRIQGGIGQRCEFTSGPFDVEHRRQLSLLLFSRL